MTKSNWFAAISASIFLAAAGCGDDSAPPADLSGADLTGVTADMSTSVKTISVATQMIAPDGIDIRTAEGKVGAELLGPALTPGIVAYPEGHPELKSAPSDATGATMLKVPQNSKLFIVTDATADFLPTISDPVAAGTVDITSGIPTHVLAAKAPSTTLAVSAGGGPTVTDLIKTGACQIWVAGTYNPAMGMVKGADSTLAVTESGYDIYGVETDGAGGFTASKKNTSKDGVFYVVPQAGTTTTATTEISATATATGKTYAPNHKCPVHPGYLAFFPIKNQ